MGCFCAPLQCHGDILLKLRKEQQQNSIAIPCQQTSTHSPNHLSSSDSLPNGHFVSSDSTRHAPLQHTPSYQSSPSILHPHDQLQPSTSNQPYRDSRQPRTPVTPQDNSEIAILIDSNRRNVDFKKLFPGENVAVYPCGTVSWAKKTVEDKLRSPKTVILHIGTNDIETRSPYSVHENLLALKRQIDEKFRCNTIISSLLTRNDRLNDSVEVCNNLLRTTIPPSNLICHSNISDLHLFDKKHLSFKPSALNVLSGCQLFATNIFAHLNGVPPSTQILESTKRFSKRRVDNTSTATHQSRPFQQNTVTMRYPGYGREPFVVNTQ